MWLVAGMILVVAVASTAWGISQYLQAATVKQPFVFSHKQHVDLEIACTDCHTRAERGAHATIPPLKVCMLCHHEKRGTHPDEPKIREMARADLEIQWRQVNRLPGHVYFSHAAHVTYAGMDCRECHGDMKEMTEPVTVSQIGHLDMNRCVACHREKSASTDCLLCHK